MVVKRLNTFFSIFKNKYILSLVFGRPPRKDKNHEITFRLFKKPPKPKLSPMTPGNGGNEAHETTSSTPLGAWSDLEPFHPWQKEQGVISLLKEPVRSGTVQERSLESMNSARMQPLPWACVKAGMEHPHLSPSSQPSLVTSLGQTESDGTYQGCPWQEAQRMDLGSNVWKRTLTDFYWFLLNLMSSRAVFPVSPCEFNSFF